MSLLQHPRPCSSSVPDDMDLNAGAGFLWISTISLSSWPLPARRHMWMGVPDMGESYRGFPAILAYWGMINVSGLSLADLHTLCLKNIITLPLPMATSCLFHTKQLLEHFLSVKFLKQLNQHDLLFFPIPTRLFLSPVACKWVVDWAIYWVPLALEPRKGKLTSVLVLWGISHHSENRALAFPYSFPQPSIRWWEARLCDSVVYCWQVSHHSHSAVFWFVDCVLIKQGSTGY